MSTTRKLVESLPDNPFKVGDKLHRRGLRDAKAEVVEVEGDNVKLAVPGHGYVTGHYSEIDKDWETPDCPACADHRFYGWTECKSCYKDFSEIRAIKKSFQ